MDPAVKTKLLAAQRNEISESQIYTWLAGRIKDEKNRKILQDIAKDERGHYEVLKRLTQTDVKPARLRVLWYRSVARVLGLSFGLRLMERGEGFAAELYETLSARESNLAKLFLDEQRHEGDLLGLIQEERIEYAGSIVLGLNDALTELTGALVGLTFALQNGKLIAATGLITGLAASMSMAASGFLSAREEGDGETSKKPLKSAAYTGIAYVATVVLLILPYLLLGNVYAAAATMMATSVLIVLAYNFYITTAKNLPLWCRFRDMAAISLSVAAISFLIGLLVRNLFGVEI
ncbi:MAG: VIT1/CCC1 transporter family protein [Verrucomicrobia bacterium]|nr:VIT1/CCC1 transporter family protein [Verrucomicrobiota bacterium]